MSQSNMEMNITVWVFAIVLIVLAELAGRNGGTSSPRSTTARAIAIPQYDQPTYTIPSNETSSLQSTATSANMNMPSINPTLAKTARPSAQPTTTTQASPSFSASPTTPMLQTRKPAPTILSSVGGNPPNEAIRVVSKGSSSGVVIGVAIGSYATGFITAAMVIKLYLRSRSKTSGPKDGSQLCHDDVHSSITETPAVMTESELYGNRTAEPEQNNCGEGVYIDIAY
ncbi:uncharacterized protein LOC135826420 [Sycon ciliatum]|uniref:uncharacterized protein LOC135826420 n=1 Tax=Sycon ciliatum TaxID=27933 RepID=UPI0031F62117